MFLILTRVLLWLLVLVLFVYIFAKIVPKEYFTFLGGLLLVVFVALLLFDPGDRTAVLAWSVLSLPFKPLGIIWILLAQAWKGMGKGKISSAATNQVRTAFVLLWLFSTPFLWQWVYHNSIERRAADLARLTVNDRAETLVVLAQDTVEPRVGARSQIQLSDRGNVLTYAAQLFNDPQTNYQRIIVSAGSRYDFPAESETDSEAEIVRDLLVDLGIPENVIFVDETGTSLRRSAIAVNEILTENDFEKRVVLVAPALSVFRSSASFSEEEIQVIPRPTDYVAFVDETGETPVNFTIESIVPSVRGLELSTQISEEYLSTMYYFLRGWLSPAELTCLECRQLE